MSVNKNTDLYKKANVEKLAADGRKVYEKIKNHYEPECNGKFLVIEPDSEDVFMAGDELGALIKANRKYPDKLFYIMKIGYEVVYTSLSPILV